MATENKVTTLRTTQTLTDEEIQAHFDAMNADGYKLLCLDNLVGWYRFFWVREV